MVIIMKVLNIGSCNLGYVYSLDHIVAEGETERSFDMRIFPGGKGLNQSVAAAKAGANVFVAGSAVFKSENPAETIKLLKENALSVL